MKNGKTIAMVTHDPSLTGRTSRTITISDGELINEAVARSLPFLTHAQMLEVTRQLQHFTYPPDGNPLSSRTSMSNIFIWSKAAASKWSFAAAGIKDVTVARLGPGEFFGEIELIRGGKSIACIRAAPEAPVELVALPRDHFVALLEGFTDDGRSPGQVSPGAFERKSDD